MGQIEIWNFDQSQLEEFADQIKVLVIKAFVHDECFDFEIADEWCKTHTIVIRKKSIFRTISDLWRKESEEVNSILHVVKSLKGNDLG